MSYLEEVLNRKPTKPIYHYTSHQGLMGIIRNKCLWATKIQYLNDEKEFIFATELARARLLRFKENANERERNFIDKMSESLTRIESVNIFVFAFSEEEDLLSQWRGYCPSGKGYSISFKLDYLETQIKKQRFKLGKCIYNHREQFKLIDEVINEHLYKEEEGRHIPDRMLDDLATIFANKFMTIAPILKDPSFSEEREWRLISEITASNDPQVNYREGNSMIIPYYEFKLADNHEDIQLEAIVVGPTPYPELASSSVASFLHRMGIRNWQIRISRIPFRSW